MATPGPFYGAPPEQVPGVGAQGSQGQRQQSPQANSAGALMSPGPVPPAPALDAAVATMAPPAGEADHIPGGQGQVVDGDVDADGAESTGQLDPADQVVHDVDPHPAKRQRLDMPETDPQPGPGPEPEPEAEAQHDPALDEAVLALAAHNGTGPGDQYGSE